MQPKSRYVCWLILFIFLSACSSLHQSTGQADTGYSRSYAATPEQVWKATVMAFEDYTLVLANQEKGQLQTDWESGYMGGDLNSQSRGLASLNDKYQNRSRLSTFITVSKDNDAPAETTLHLDKEILSYNKVNGVFESVISNGVQENQIFEKVAKYLKELEAKSAEK